MIEYRGVTKRYGDVPVVKGIDLTIQDGEFLVLIGPSGCGKTTTLKMLNRLIPMDGGDILIDGESIMSRDAEDLRRNIGYVIQQIGLFPNMTVEQNITVVPRLLKWDKARCHERVRELLNLVDMDYETHAHKYPNELSGGQQQRIGVLRALAAEPPIVLMDEPFGALDPITRDTLQDEVKSLQQRLHKTIIFVTHDMNEAIKLADRIVFMYEGRVLQCAAPEEMLRSPADEVIREFMGKHVQRLRMEDDLTCADIMRRRVATVSPQRKTLECVELMNQREVNSLIAVDDDRKFQGVVTIEDIRDRGVAGQPITALLRTDAPCVRTTQHAKDAFNLLMETKADYVVVVTPENRLAGIVTKTSLSKAMASALWGNES